MGPAEVGSNGESKGVDDDWRDVVKLADIESPNPDVHVSDSVLGSTELVDVVSEVHVVFVQRAELLSAESDEVVAEAELLEIDVDSRNDDAAPDGPERVVVDVDVMEPFQEIEPESPEVEIVEAVVVVVEADAVSEMLINESGVEAVVCVPDPGSPDRESPLLLDVTAVDEDEISEVGDPDPEMLDTTESNVPENDTLFVDVAGVRGPDVV